MDYLYSRKRIKAPKIFIYNHNNNKKVHKTNLVYLIIIVLITVSILGIRAVTPVFNKLCQDKAKGVATLICNRQTSRFLKNYNYSDFIIVHMDDSKNVKMLEANMKNINIVISEVTEKIQEDIINSQSEDMYISLGSFTGISILSGRGPKIPIRISSIGNIDTDLKSVFESKGVNQTIHRLYLEIDCEISILTPFNTVNEQINNQFIIAENIVVGNIPETYYNLEGMTEDDVMEVMQ